MSVRKVLVYGENPNDTKSIAFLLEALCPAMRGRLAIRRGPLLLVKNTKLGKIATRADKAAQLLTAENTKAPVACVFMHEDADAVEPAHIRMCEEKERVLLARGHTVYAVTPAWEIESWWLMWPDAVGGLRAKWRTPDKYRGRNVGTVMDAKEELRRLLRPQGAPRSFRTYEELDSPLIAQKIRDLGLARSPQASSASYQRFIDGVDRYCNA
jgi:hypothetical protein